MSDVSSQQAPVVSTASSSGLAKTGASMGLGGAVAVIVAAHYPQMSAAEVSAWGVIFASVVGFVAHSGWGSKLFPKS